MNGGSNTQSTPATPEAGTSPPARAQAEADAAVAPWLGGAEDAEPEPRFSGRLPAIAAAVLILAWTGFYAWAWAAERPPVHLTMRDWTGLIAAWASPLALIAVAWLLATRSSRHEARRFGEVSRALATESTALEVRLLTVNRELSLAREFIAAQARELEAIGRVSYERVSDSARSLQALVAVNAEQVEAIGKVSHTALDNMARLRGDLPVIVTAAKDVANQIGNAGRLAHEHIETVRTGLNRLDAASAANGEQIASLDGAVEQALGEFNAQCAKLADITEQRFAVLAQRGTAFRAELDAHEAAALGAVRARAGALADELEHLRGRVAADEEAAFGRLRERLARLTDDGTRLSRQLDETQTRATATWRDAVARLEGDLDEALSSLAAAETRAHEAGRERLDTLAEAQHALDRDIAARRDAQLRDSEAMADTGTALVGRLEESEQRMAAVAVRARALLGEIEASGEAAVRRARDDLAEAVALLGETADAVEKRLTALAPEASATFADHLADETGRALETVLRASVAESTGRLEQAAAHAAGITREAAHQMRDEIAGIDALAAALEARVAAAREQAAAHADDPFARRAALITEALNAAAIDIAGAISTDVPDTAWAAYLRGDRSVFTRRTVSLLSAGERRSVAALYEAEPAFREQVSRYVGEFEAMLRQVLSARDGQVLGVTLVSSDLGKLYVALAQAIARLRS